MRQIVKWMKMMAVCLPALVYTAHGAGIPEAGLMMYGVIRNDLGGVSARLTSGSLSWTIAPATGSAITVRTVLTNINDQFSYAIQVPFESVLQGMTLSSNALMLTAGSGVYDRSQVRVTLDGTNEASAVLRLPAGANFPFGRAERGTVERVDLDVAVALPDGDGDGLPDFWEIEHFSGQGATPGGDPDGDGVSNRQEYLAGTDPNDPESVFEIKTHTERGRGLLLQWRSASNRYYRISRSEDLRSGFLPIATNVWATPPENTYTDTNAPGAGPYYYHIKVE
ncbi:MAG: thrombospondin type 3 repeat-containing protein [bacterium]